MRLKYRKNYSDNDIECTNGESIFSLIWSKNHQFRGRISSSGPSLTDRYAKFKFSETISMLKIITSAVLL